RPARRRALYLHEGEPHRPVRPGPARRRDRRLVSGQLPQTLRPPRLHGRADARSALAARSRDPARMATAERLILASSSPARRDLLTRAGYAFEVRVAHIDEPGGAGVTDPRAYVQNVAWLKAAAVAPRVNRGIVLAADTVGWLNGEIIGKPAD